MTRDVEMKIYFKQIWQFILCIMLASVLAAHASQVESKLKIDNNFITMVYTNNTGTAYHIAGFADGKGNYFCLVVEFQDMAKNGEPVFSYEKCSVAQFIAVTAIKNHICESTRGRNYGN